ncbi:MAG: GDSL-type esterase/lipase family protein [Steroidobacteraceae bacterium]
MRLIASLAALLLLALGTLHADPAHAANQWESEIVAFENADKTSPPPKGAIVVTGSSTIRLWNTIKTDLAPLDIIPRGFGGSTADDLDYYLERIVLVYEPRAVVIYEGDNDISGGKSPQYIADRMAGILARISARLPNARVYVLAIKPSPARWTEWPNAQQANQLFAALCATDARYTYINAGSILLGSNGQPNPAYYQSDGLHLNGTGYSFWTSVIRPVLIAQQSVPLPADATAPTVPTGLTATAISSSRIDLRWNASSDSGVGLAGYQVRRGGIAVATTTATKFSDPGLTANTAFSYTVSAYDRVTPNRNESANSAAASASTPPATTTPAPTVTLTAAPNAITVGGTTLLTWSSTDATSCTASGGLERREGNERQHLERGAELGHHVHARLHRRRRHHHRERHRDGEPARAEHQFLGESGHHRHRQHHAAELDLGLRELLHGLRRLERQQAAQRQRDQRDADGHDHVHADLQRRGRLQRPQRHRHRDRAATDRHADRQPDQRRRRRRRSSPGAAPTPPPAPRPAAGAARSRSAARSRAPRSRSTPRSR